MAGPRTLLLAGVPTRLEVADPWLAAAVIDGLGELPPVEAPAELMITDQGDPTPPAGDPDDTLGVVRAWRREGVLFRSWGDVVVARADDRAVVLARTGDPATVGRAVRQLLPQALGHLLGAHDRVLLHGGAVLDASGAIVVLGPTGTGKSTLVYAARSGGRAVLSDDLVVITRHGDDLEATGIPRSLSVATDGPEGLPADARALTDDLRQRWQFPLDGVGGPHPMVAVIVTEHSADTSGHVEPLTASELWDVVLGSHFAAGEPGRLRAAFPVLAAVSRLPGWRLGHGSDPATRLTVAAHLLDSIAHACRV